MIRWSAKGTLASRPEYMLVIDVLFSGENYEPESGSYQTQIESDLSYEAILAREAADENYVDEKTGEVIPSVGSADGTSLSDEKDAGGQTADAGACLLYTSPSPRD